MPSYLWPITSPCLVLAGYKLVRSGPWACLSSMYIQNLHAAHAFTIVGLHSLLSVLDYFLVPLSFMVCPTSGLGIAWWWALLLFSLPFFLLPFPTIPLYHSCYEVVCLNPAGPLWAYRLFFSQWPSMTIGSFITSVAGSCVQFVFPWASRTRLLSLGFLGPFLNFAFPWVFTEFFGLPRPNYIISHPWGSWACHQPLTFFAFIALGLPWPILTFPHHILPMVCFFSLSELL